MGAGALRFGVLGFWGSQFRTLEQKGPFEGLHERSICSELVDAQDSQSHAWPTWPSLASSCSGSGGRAGRDGRQTLGGWESPPRAHAGNGPAPAYAKSHAQCPEKLRRAWITTARYQHGFPTTRASAKHSAKAIHGHPESRLVVAERPLLQSRVGLPRMILAVTLLEDASETCANDNNIQFAGPWHQI